MLASSRSSELHSPLQRADVHRVTTRDWRPRSLTQWIYAAWHMPWLLQKTSVLSGSMRKPYFDGVRAPRIRGDIGLNEGASEGRRIAQELLLRPVGGTAILGRKHGEVAFLHDARGPVVLVLDAEECPWDRGPHSTPRGQASCGRQC